MRCQSTQQKYICCLLEELQNWSIAKFYCVIAYLFVLIQTCCFSTSYFESPETLVVFAQLISYFNLKIN